MRVALRELQGPERLDVFCNFPREISRRLGKPVLTDPEGDDGHPVIGFDFEGPIESSSSLIRRTGDCGRRLRFMKVPSRSIANRTSALLRARHSRAWVWCLSSAIFLS